MELSEAESPLSPSQPFSPQLAGLQAMIELERTTRETGLRRVENQVALAIRGMARLSADAATASVAGHAADPQAAPALDPAGEARITSSIRSTLTLEFTELQLAISDARAAVKEEAEQRAAGDRAVAESTWQVRRSLLQCVAALEDLSRARCPHETCTHEGVRVCDVDPEERWEERQRLVLEGIRRELACDQESSPVSIMQTSPKQEGRGLCASGLARCSAALNVLRPHEDQILDVIDIKDAQSHQKIEIREQGSALDQDGVVPKQVMHKQIQASFIEKDSDVEYCTNDVARMILEHKAFVEGRLCDVQSDAAHQNDVQEDRYTELQSAIIALTSCVSQIQDATGQMATFTAQAAAKGQFYLMPDGVPSQRQEAPLSPSADVSMMKPVAGAAAERAESIAAAVASEGGITWSRLEPLASSLSRGPSPTRRATSAEPSARAKVTPPCEPLTPVSENVPSRPVIRPVSRGRSQVGREVEVDSDVADDVSAIGAPPARHASPIQTTTTPRGLVRHGVLASPPIDSSSVPRVRQPLGGSAACPPGESLSSVFSGVPLCSPQVSSNNSSRLGHLWPTTFRVANGSASLPLGGNSVWHTTLHEDVPQGVKSFPSGSGHGSPTAAFAHRTTLRARNSTPSQAPLAKERVMTGPAVAVSSGSLRVGPGASSAGQHSHPMSNAGIRAGSPPPATPGYMTPRPLQYR